jgi:hypothetical protein
MCKTIISILILLVVCSAPAAAQERHDPPKTDEGAQEQLRQRAQAASGGERAKLFTELSRQEMETANQYFTDGDAAKGQDEVKQSEADAEKGAQAALTSDKRLKQTEIELRKLQKRTEDIRHTLAFEDRAALEAVENKLEELRRSLLQKMFGGKGKS